MEANPEVGDFYRQEVLLNTAEDSADVLDVNQTVTVPAGIWSILLRNDCDRMVLEFLHAMAFFGKTSFRGLGRAQPKRKGPVEESSRQVSLKNLLAMRRLCTTHSPKSNRC